MAKFKAGDKIVRTAHVSAYNQHLMKVGGVYTVSHCGSSCLNVEEDHGVWDWFVDGFDIVPNVQTYSLLDIQNKLKIVMDILQSNVQQHPQAELVEKEVMLAQGWLEKAYNNLGK